MVMDMRFVILVAGILPSALGGDADPTPGNTIRDMMLRQLRDVGTVMEDVKVLISDYEGIKAEQSNSNVKLGELDTKLEQVRQQLLTSERTKGCDVQLRGFGLDDPKPWHGFIKVNGKDVVSFNIRGIWISVIEPGNCTLIEYNSEKFRRFDPYRVESDDDALVELVEEVPAGHIILAATGDEITGGHNLPHGGNHVEKFRQSLRSLGINLPVLEYRSSLVFVAVKGSSQRGLVDVRQQGKGPARLHTVV